MLRSSNARIVLTDCYRMITASAATRQNFAVLVPQAVQAGDAEVFAAAGLKSEQQGEHGGQFNWRSAVGTWPRGNRRRGRPLESRSSARSIWLRPAEVGDYPR